MNHGKFLPKIVGTVAFFRINKHLYANRLHYKDGFFCIYKFIQQILKWQILLVDENRRFY